MKSIIYIIGILLWVFVIGANYFALIFRAHHEYTFMLVLSLREFIMNIAIYPRFDFLLFGGRSHIM